MQSKPKRSAGRPIGRISRHTNCNPIGAIHVVARPKAKTKATAWVALSCAIIFLIIFIFLGKQHDIRKLIFHRCRHFKLKIRIGHRSCKFGVSSHIIRCFLGLNRLSALSSEKGKIRRSATIPHKRQVAHLGAFFNAKRSKNTASTSQLAVIAMLTI